jgi:hypothetical protein
VDIGGSLPAAGREYAFTRGGLGIDSVSMSQEVSRPRAA